MESIPERNEESEGESWTAAWSETDDQDEAPPEVTCPECRCPVSGCRCESGWPEPSFWQHFTRPLHPEGTRGHRPELDEEPWPA